MSREKLISAHGGYRNLKSFPLTRMIAYTEVTLVQQAYARH